MGESVARVHCEEIHHGLRAADPHGPFAGLSPDDAFLDIGGGTGTLSRRARTTTGARTVGVSLFPWEVDRATALSGDAGREGTSFQAADVTALPFPDSAFASAAAIEVLVHVPDKRAALARTIRPPLHISSWPHLPDLPSFSAGSGIASPPFRPTKTAQPTATNQLWRYLTNLVKPTIVTDAARWTRRTPTRAEHPAEVWSPQARPNLLSPARSA